MSLSTHLVNEISVKYAVSMVFYCKSHFIITVFTTTKITFFFETLEKLKNLPMEVFPGVLWGFFVRYWRGGGCVNFVGFGGFFGWCLCVRVFLSGLGFFLIKTLFNLFWLDL